MTDNTKKPDQSEDSGKTFDEVSEPISTVTESDEVAGVAPKAASSAANLSDDAAPALPFEPVVPLEEPALAAPATEADFAASIIPAPGTVYPQPQQATVPAAETAAMPPVAQGYAPVVTEPAAGGVPLAAPGLNAPTPGYHNPYYPIPMQEEIAEPKIRSNRGFAILNSFLATIVFAGALLGVQILLGMLNYVVTGAAELWYNLLMYPNYYLSVAAFFVFTLCYYLIVNRGGWGFHIFGSLLIAALTTAGFGLGRIWEESVWNNGVTFEALLTNYQFIALAAVTFVLAREVLVWVGLMSAARGKRLKARYEKELADSKTKAEEVNIITGDS